MAETKVYTCDICKQSKSESDLARINVRAKGIKMKDMDFYNDFYNDLKIDVCPDCLRKKGFVVETKNSEEEEQAKLQNKATLEDKIYEFLQDMGVVFEE